MKFLLNRTEQYFTLCSAKILAENNNFVVANSTQSEATISRFKEASTNILFSDIKNKNNEKLKRRLQQLMSAVVTVVVLGCSLLNLACANDDKPPIYNGYQWPADTTIEYLFEQPLEVIQKYTYGKWKLFRYDGGIIPSYYGENAPFLEIKKDSIIVTRLDTNVSMFFYITSPYRWELRKHVPLLPSSRESYAICPILDYEYPPVTSPLFPYSITNDTLFLWAGGSMMYLFIRVKEDNK